MFGLRIHVIENRVVLVKGGGVKFLLPWNNAAINIVEKMVVIVQLVREVTVVVKDIPGFLLGMHGRFGCHLDWDWQSCGNGR